MGRWGRGVTERGLYWPLESQGKLEGGRGSGVLPDGALLRQQLLPCTCSYSSTVWGCCHWETFSSLLWAPCYVSHGKVSWGGGTILPFTPRCTDGSASAQLLWLGTTELHLPWQTLEGEGRLVPHLSTWVGVLLPFPHLPNLCYCLQDSWHVLKAKLKQLLGLILGFGGVGEAHFLLADSR